MCMNERNLRAERLRHFTLAVADPTDTKLSAVFPELPRDTGHFSVRYFPHVLRGLRIEIPAYVQDVLTGQRPPSSVTEKVGGIVVVRC